MAALDERRKRRPKCGFSRNQPTWKSTSRWSCSTGDPSGRSTSRMRAMNSSPRRRKICRSRSSLLSKNEYTDPTESSASSATSLRVAAWKPLRPKTSSAASSSCARLISWWCRRRCSRRLSPPPSFLVAILESWFISSYLAITPRDLGAGTEGGMMTRRLPTRGAAAALALVLLGGACTTESSDGAGGDGGDGSATAADIEVGQSTWDPDNVEV